MNPYRSFVNYTVTISILFAFVATLALQPQVRAGEAPATTPYSGDIWTRSTLTGDWGGLRNQLAEKGVTFDLSITQVGQGVVRGGKNGAWQYGGRGDIVMNVDSGKLGLWPGGFLEDVRARASD